MWPVLFCAEIREKPQRSVGGHHGATFCATAWGPAVNYTLTPNRSNHSTLSMNHHRSTRQTDPLDVIPYSRRDTVLSASHHRSTRQTDLLDVITYTVGALGEPPPINNTNRTAVSSSSYHTKKTIPRNTKLRVHNAPIRPRSFIFSFVRDGGS